MRLIHKWSGLILAPFLVFLTLTGIFLLVRDSVSWIQPQTERGSAKFQPTLPLELMLAEARLHKADTKVESWKDIQMLDLRPSAGIIKIRPWNEKEIQVDAKTGLRLSGPTQRLKRHRVAVA